MIVKNLQSLLDIGIQASGTAEAAFDIAILNDLSLTDIVAVGSKIQVSQVQNRRVATFFRTNELFPATGTNNTEGIFDFTFYIIFN